MAFVEEGHASKQFACSDVKKNVFLIGDSIRMGYCEATREDLADVAEKNGVSVNDLFAVAQSWDSSCYRDYCHFTPETAKQLGKIVAARLRTYL